MVGLSSIHFFATDQPKTNPSMSFENVLLPSKCIHVGSHPVTIQTLSIFESLLLDQWPKTTCPTRSWSSLGWRGMRTKLWKLIRKLSWGRQVQHPGSDCPLRKKKKKIKAFFNLKSFIKKRLTWRGHGIQDGVTHVSPGSCWGCHCSCSSTVGTIKLT